MSESTPDPETCARWLTWYRAAREGNAEARDQLLVELRPFFRAALQKLASGQAFGAWDRSDVAQDCFVNLLSLPPEREFRGTTGQEFAAWVRTMVQREYLDAVRHANAQKRGGGQVGSLPGEANGEVTVPSETSTPSKAMIRQEEKRQFEEAVSQLSEKYQLVVRLRCSTERLTWAQIAGRVGETEDTVKQWFHRAREQLGKMRRDQP
jgi:RNA polymerase sigma factor (sigma-70 family)